MTVIAIAGIDARSLYTMQVTVVEYYGFGNHCKTITPMPRSLKQGQSDRHKAKRPISVNAKAKAKD